MTRALVLLAHPRAGSFNHAIFDRAIGTLERVGIEVDAHDLYAEGFDPVLRADETYTSGQSATSVLHASDDLLLVAHRHAIAMADVLVIVHPNWWGKPPAMLAGWLDRVLVPGVAYRLDAAGGVPTPLLAVKHLIVFTTSDTPEERERDRFGDPLALIWGRCIVPYIGEPTFRRRVYRVVGDSSSDVRSGWLDDVEASIRSLLLP